MSLVPLFAACAISAVATFIDLRERRIPNWLTWPSALLGLAFHALDPNPPLLLDALAGGAVGAAVFFPMYWLGGIGGGDAKLALALGCLLGSFEATVRLLFFTTVAGALYALIAAARRGQLGNVFRRLFSKEARKTTEPITFAYAPAFLLGTLAYAALLLA